MMNHNDMDESHSTSWDQFRSESGTFPASESSQQLRRSSDDLSVRKSGRRSSASKTQGSMRRSKSSISGINDAMLSVMRNRNKPKRGSLNASFKASSKSENSTIERMREKLFRQQQGGARLGRISRSGKFVPAGHAA